MPAPTTLEIAKKQASEVAKKVFDHEGTPNYVGNAKASAMLGIVGVLEYFDSSYTFYFALGFCAYETGSAVNQYGVEKSFNLVKEKTYSTYEFLHNNYNTFFGNPPKKEGSTRQRIPVDQAPLNETPEPTNSNQRKLN